MTHRTDPPIRPLSELRQQGPRDTASLAGRRKAGANQSDLGSFNEAAIIEAIRQAGSISRTEISEQTGLTQQSVSRILRVLLERGLLAEGAQERTERLGKPRTPVRLRAEAAHAAGVLVDPELVSVVLSDLDGRAIERRRIALDAEIAPDALVELIAECVEEVVADSRIDTGTFLGVGVAAPGSITPDGRLLDLPLLVDIMVTMMRRARGRSSSARGRPPPSLLPRAVAPARRPAPPHRADDVAVTEDR